MKTQLTSLNKIAALTLGTALLLAGSSPARAAEPAMKDAAMAKAPAPRVFGGLVAETQHLKAVVQSINYETREVVLKGEKGMVRTVTAGPEIKRLAEIKVGDTVELGLIEALAVFFGDAAGAPARDQSVEVVRAAKEDKPGAALVTTTRVLATVEALDFKARTATLKGPNRTVTINVSADAVNFEQAKVGDSVYLEYSQAVAVAVTKSAPAK